MGSGKAPRNAVAVAAIAALLVGAGTAHANRGPAIALDDAAIQLVRDSGLSRAEARERLQLQDKAGDLAAELEEALGSEFAGVWFDDDAGRFAIATTPETDRAEVRKLLAEKGLEGDTDLVAAEATWDDLVAQQAAWDRRVAGLLRAQQARTSIDPAGNRVVVTLSGDVPAAKRAELTTSARLAPAPVAVVTAPAERLKPVAEACLTSVSYCDAPVRGGIRINSATSSSGFYTYCSSAFSAADGSGARYLLTAGHCLRGDPAWATLPWSTENSSGGTLGLGAPTPSHIGVGTGDVGAVAVPGGVSAAPAVLMRGAEEARPVKGVSTSYIGQYLCGSGTTSGVRCGQVNWVHATIPLDIDGTIITTSPMDGVAGPSACSAGGDSGSTWIAGNYGAGIHSASDSGCVIGETNWFTPLATAEAALGLRTIVEPSTPHVAYVDATNGDTITDWRWDSTLGWQQTFLFGHRVAAGTSPSTVVVDGKPYVFYVDAANSDSLTVWTRDPALGWQQTFLFGHRVAAGTSPAAVVVDGRPRVYFSDATNGGRITEWRQTTSGWTQTALGGNAVSAGTSPAAAVVGREPRVYFSDAVNGDRITQWSWNSASGWQQTPFYGHRVAAGTRPSAVVNGGEPRVYYVDADNNDTITEWSWNSTRGWHQTFFFGHRVSPGSSPSAVVNVNGDPVIFFPDDVNNDSLTAWVWAGSAGWQQAFLFGHPVTAGTSPSAAIVSGNAYVYFADVTNGDSVTVWTWTPATSWQQTFLTNHTVAPGTSPSASGW